MKFLKIIGYVVATIVVIFLIAIMIMSPRTHVERSIIINAAPGRIYDHLNGFKDFTKWAPWTQLDPKTQYTYEGPETGAGAKMSWKSDSPEVGSGSQWIVESENNKWVKSRLNFGDDEGEYFAQFTLIPTASGTKVTWAYDGDVTKAGFIVASMSKIMGPFMDTLLGSQYETGLKNLKTMIDGETPP